MQEKPSLGERIKIIRSLKKLSQEEFAAKLGVHRGHISKIETQGAQPSEDLLLEICLTFDVSPAWLLVGYGRMYESEILDKVKAYKDQVKQKGVFILLYDVILNRFNHLVQCIDDPEIFRLQDDDVKPGDPIIVEVLRKIIQKKEMGLDPYKGEWNCLDDFENAVLKILRELGEDELRDIWVLLAAKADRMPEPSRKQLRTEIDILKDASLPLEGGKKERKQKLF